MSENNTWHGTTIVLIRKDGNVVIPKVLRKWMANQEVIESK